MTKIAIVGSGAWGINIIKNMAQLEALAAICDKEENNFFQLKSLYPEIRLTNNLDEVLSDTNIQAVVIATTPETHYELAKKSILAKKDVWIEKPMTMDIKSSQHLLELSNKTDQIVMAGHILIYHPAVVKLKEIVDRKELGEIFYLFFKRVNFGRIRSLENALWSLAPHDISVLLHLIKEMPKKISCTGAAFMQNQIEDIALCSLMFPSGIVAYILTSWLAPVKERTLTVVGSKKMAVLNELGDQDKIKIIGYEAKSSGDCLNLNKITEVFPEVADQEPLYNECKHFLNCVATRQKTQSGVKEGLEVVKILEKATVSLKNKGEWVKLS